MAEFEEKLGAILNDPKAMEQIMALAQSLGGNHGKHSEPQPTATPAPSEQDIQEATFVPVFPQGDTESSEERPFPGLDIDPRWLALGTRALSAYQDQNNEKALLLQALRPFVKEDRAKKVDKAVQITRISKAIRTILDGFKEGREGV